MKAEFTLNTNIGAMCDQSPGVRYALHHAQVTPDPEQSVVYVTATDGRGMAIVQAVGSADEQCLMPASMSPSKVRDLKSGVKVTHNGQWVSGNGNGHSGVDTDCRYPSSVTNLIDIDLPNTYDVRLDVHLLARLANALNRDGNPFLTLFFRENDKYVAVLGDKGIGGLMPVALSGEEKGIYAQLRDRIIAAYKAARALTKNEEKPE